MREDPIIELRNLTKRYKKSRRNAVDGISFEVSPGRFFALLGPNGAGKTTTISILTTTLRPTSGEARIAGYDVVREAARVREQVSIIFQNPSLDMNLTAEENVRIHAILHGLYPYRPTFGTMPEAYKRKVHELADLLGIKRDIFKPVKRFSGGMKRKLEIVRSLMRRPKVLFLDEPTTGLDAASRRSLWTYLREVQRDAGTTFFLTTHYLEEAEGADTVCIINHGRVVAFGKPAEIKADLLESYLVVDAQDRDRLRQELESIGVSFHEVPQFKIPMAIRDTHQLLKTIDTPLTMVRTHAPTLEEAYLEIIGRS